jgi:heat shock protein HslJ
VLTESSGGSGSRLYVSAVTARYGAPVGYGTALVGDRPQVRSVAIVDGRIRFELIAHGPEDAACCPTFFWTKEWAVVQGTLQQVSALMGERLSVGALAGPDWVLTHLDIGEPAPDEPELTVRFEDGRLAGRSGCNGYFAELTESAPGQIRVGPVGSTRMACPPEIMRLEQGYLERLGQLSRYGFWRGRLALTWQADDGFGSFLFEPRPAAGT